MMDEENQEGYGILGLVHDFPSRKSHQQNLKFYCNQQGGNNHGCNPQK
jgi:hypothetical protein